VIARIGAFNHPLLFTAGKCGAPLVTGNTLVVKPAADTPLTSLRIAELWHGIFPPGVFNVVTGGRDAGAALVAHPKVAKIGFIGSVNAGRAVMQGAAASLKALTLELGGKNALIGCADVSADEVAEGVVRGMNFRYVTGNRATRRAASICTNRSRRGARSDRPARAGAQGRLPFEPTASRVPVEPGAVRQDDELHQARRRRRAPHRLRRQAPRRSEARRGLFVEPTCSPTSPTTCASRARRSSGRSCRSCAGRTRTTCWRASTRSITAHRVDLDARPRPRASLCVARRSGYVWVNGASTHHVGVPFGGVKQSGIGREESIEELYACTQIKNVNVTLKK
jgi:betaine-aldehyde dehydrogenase